MYDPIDYATQFAQRQEESQRFSEELASALGRSKTLLERSGTPVDGIRFILSRQAAGWISEGLTAPNMAVHVWTEFLANNLDLLDHN